VIENSHTVVTLPCGVRTQRRLEPVGAPQAPRDQEMPQARARQAPGRSNVETAVVELQRHQQEENDVFERVDLDYRARHAIHAYTSWQQVARREYVTRLLGVDDYA